MMKMAASSVQVLFARGFAGTSSKSVQKSNKLAQMLRGKQRLSFFIEM